MLCFIYLFNCERESPRLFEIFSLCDKYGELVLNGIINGFYLF